MEEQKTFFGAYLLLFVFKRCYNYFFIHINVQKALKRKYSEFSFEVNGQILLIRTFTKKRLSTKCLFEQSSQIRWLSGLCFVFFFLP